MSSSKSTAVQAVIRQIQPRDLDDIFDVYRSLVGEERAFTDTQTIRENLAQMIDLSFVADIGKEVVGFIIGQHGRIGQPPVESCWIEGLGVHPLYQHQGIAGRLVTSMSEAANRTGMGMVRVMLNEKDSHMEGFFKKMNFNRARLIVYDRVLT